jgi:hypothetical protein
MGAFFLAVLVVIGFGLRSLIKPQSVTLANDLGTERSESAGIGGRLIAEWKDGASYRLIIDPLEPGDLPAFEAVAGNLPHAVIFAITLRDSSGGVACEKQIVLTSSTAPGSASLQNSAMPASATGDTAKGVTDEDGKIEELVLSGPLSCQLDAFKKIAAWEFSTDFPRSPQPAGMNAEGAATRARSRSGGGQRAAVQALAAAIEGDDVIVGDNPSRGLVSTSGGRTFLVGVKHVFAWRTFPAPVHFRCEKDRMCALTSSGSSTVVSARLAP